MDCSSPPPSGEERTSVDTRGVLRRRTFSTMTAMAAVALTAGCGDTGADAGSGATTLTIATDVGLGFDPKDAQPGYFEQYLQPLYDALFRLDADGQPTPHLVTSWSYSEDQLVLTLVLRAGVTFSDGMTLDSAAVKASLENNGSGTSTTAGQLALVTQIDTPDGATVVLTLSAPDPSLVPNLGQSAGMVASPRAIAAGTLRTAPVGSGPYTLDARATTNGSTYAFVRNPDYWKPEDYPFDRVVLKVLTDNTAILNGLRAGQLSAGPLASAKDGVAAEKAGLNVMSFRNGDLEALYLFDKAGTIVPALADVRVRRAINHAIDRETIVRVRTLGEGQATTQMFCISTDDGIYDPALDDAYPYDPQKARELLQEAGFGDGFEVTMPDWSAYAPEIIAALTQDLEAVGISVTLETAPLNQLYANTLAGRYPIGWQPYDDNRPWDLTQFQLTADSPWNPFRYEDPTVTALIENIQGSTGDEQLGHYVQLNDHLVDQAWCAPLNAAVFTYATSALVTATPIAYGKRPPLWTYRRTS